MNPARARVATLVVALLLTACSGPNADLGGADALASTPPATPPAPQAAPGAVCDARYGNAPRPETNSVNGFLGMASLCGRLYGEALTTTDANGTPRAACLISPPGTAPAAPRPLVVWLHPALLPIDSVLTTDLLPRVNSADLTGDPLRPGFSLLLVAGRDTEHFLPTPAATGLGWDTWYRNLDRNSPALNVDVATIDHFIAEVKARDVVDTKRMYLSGWSNGAAMAQLYSLNTPGIAAAAVYSAPNPFDDSTDPCPQAAFGNNTLPLLHVGNRCDIFGICASSEALLMDLETRGLAAPVQSIRLSADLRVVQGCATVNYCQEYENTGSIAGLLDIGTFNHLRWPFGQTGTMLEFLKQHPLP